MATTFAVPDGRVAMNAVTRNGFGPSGGSITSLQFQPDLVWEKARNGAYNHQLMDSIRGASKSLHSNLTSAEDTYPTYLLSFNTNGYTFGAGDYTTGDTLVDWCWKAGGTAVSNTAGTITSSVSANTTAGFSVVTYTGNGTTSTRGHGLGAVPSMIIVKRRDVADNWAVYHASLGNTIAIFLNLTQAQYANVVYWDNTSPTSTVFTVRSASEVNVSGGSYVAYCWAPVAGYSAFGSYTGNGAGPNGPFVYLGFRPRWLMIKCSSNSTTYTSWYMVDTAREPGNISSGTVPDLWANLAVAEGYRGNGVANPDTANYVDMLSNGFKVISTNSDEVNTSGYTYIYAAFAENPLKYANAR